MKRWRHLLLAAAGLWLLVPVRAELLGAADALPRALPELQRGTASWYGPGFHGRPTASGERFDMNARTAAHPSLPFGTVVRVRSLINGRTVDVRINDRGPHTGRRIIDLSRAAARALGFTGTKPVAITVIRPAPARARAAVPAPRRSR